MVKEVMMNHDSVTLPGLGSFMAELVPASFSDKGYTINPPYRRLYFIPHQGSDTLLADLYSTSNNVNIADATRILVEFLSEMKEVLITRKIVVFPGLGRLRATRENHFFFVADEDLDIYPEGFGLEPVSLKTHEETPCGTGTRTGTRACHSERPYACHSERSRGISRPGAKTKTSSFIRQNTYLDTCSRSHRMHRPCSCGPRGTRLA